MDSLRSRIPPIPQKNLEEMERMKRRNLSGLLSNIPEAVADITPSGKAGQGVGMAVGMLLPKWPIKGSAKVSKYWNKGREKQAKDMLKSILQFKKAASSALDAYDIWTIWNKKLPKEEKKAVRDTIWQETGTDVARPDQMLVQARSSKDSHFKGPVKEFFKGENNDLLSHHPSQLVRLGDIYDSPDLEAVEGLADMPVKLNTGGGFGKQGSLLTEHYTITPSDLKDPTQWDKIAGGSRQHIKSPLGKSVDNYLQYPAIELTKAGLLSGEYDALGTIHHEGTGHYVQRQAGMPSGTSSSAFRPRVYGTKRQTNKLVKTEEALNKIGSSLLDIKKVQLKPDVSFKEAVEKGLKYKGGFQPYLLEHSGRKILITDLGLTKKKGQSAVEGVFGEGTGHFSEYGYGLHGGINTRFIEEDIGKEKIIEREHLNLIDDLKKFQWQEGLHDPDKIKQARHYWRNVGEMEARQMEHQKDYSYQEMLNDPYFRYKIPERASYERQMMEFKPEGYSELGDTNQGARRTVRKLFPLSETHLLKDETIDKIFGRKKREWKGIPKSRK